MNATVVELALKVSMVMATAAATVAVMHRRFSAASRHLVWTLAVAGVLALPVVSPIIPSWSIPVRHVPSAAAPDARPLSSPVSAPQESGLPREKDENTLLPRTARGSSSGLPQGWRTTLLPAVYIGGIVFFLIRLGVGQQMMRTLVSRSTPITDPVWTGLLRECLARAGIRRSVLLVRTPEHTIPMTCGLRRPVIVIPPAAETWDADRRRAVLLHEIAHVGRLDCLTQTLAELMVAVYWLHPGAWWIAQRLRIERELACDDRVLASGTEPRDYAGHLLDIAYSLGRLRAPAVAVAMARSGQLERRMLAALDGTRNRTAPALSRRFCALIVAALLLVPLAAATIVVVPAAASGQTPRRESASISPAPQQPAESASLSPGTWQLRIPADGRSVHLTLSDREGSFHGTSLPVDRLEGLAQLLRDGGPAHFRLRRDAGIFDFEGIIRSGTGGGTVTFTPSAAFPVDLARRGFARPTPEQQQSMAWSDIGFIFIDELAAQKYARPDLDQLVRAARHGVTTAYVKEMAELGYRFGTVDGLVRQRDHGVSSQFIRDLRAQGLGGLTGDDLVRARDHGVGPEYLGELRTLGYGSLTLDDLVRARDHGISPDYVRQLRQLGYRLSLADLTRARDHGVSVEYVKSLAGLGYEHVSLDDLVRLRDHGVSPEWLRAARQKASSPLSIDDLIRMRNRGVDRLEDLPPSRPPGLLPASLHSWNLRTTLERLARWLN
jgi:beta-lactamase regulating signal transducer with metallopeptidase domain